MGDFVYIKNDDSNLLVSQIFNLYQGESSAGVRVVWFFRPGKEQFSLSSKEQSMPKQKFIEKEVLRTNGFENYNVDQIVGRCQVLHVKDYVRGNVAHISPDDTYVCENRFSYCF